MTVRRAGLGVSALALGAVVLGALLAGALAPHDPRAITGPPLSPPNPHHPLGTNELGQDLLSAWLHGGRTSLAIAAAVATLSTLAAGAAGVLSVTWRRARAPLLGVTDAALAIPHLPLAVLLVALLGSGVWQVVLALALVSWPAYARVVRSQALVALGRDYVAAARVAGASEARIVRTCVVPEIAPLLWTKLALTVRWALLTEAALGLMGLGSAHALTWGRTLHDAFAYPLLFLSGAWQWWALPPAATIAGLTLALAALGHDAAAYSDPARTASLV